MTKAIRIHAAGGTDVLSFDSVDLPTVGPEDVLIRQTACGVNFIDIYHRSGLYPLPLPTILGMEAAGVVEEVGSNVTAFKKGDRVAYGAGPIGGYAEARVMPWQKLVALPESISDDIAAAVMLQGMTVEYLIHRTFAVKPGDTVLFHAISGGVGTLACQWLKQIGATVIGTTGSSSKVALAKENGCDHVLNTNDADWPAQVREITKGKGVPVVYDSVGAATFNGTLDCLAPRGLFVSFGNASGPVPPFEPGILAQKGSLFFTRPTVMHYTLTRDELVGSTDRLFAALNKGMKVHLNQRYKLADAAQAHRDLEGRKTTGASILIP